MTSYSKLLCSITPSPTNTKNTIRIPWRYIGNSIRNNNRKTNNQEQRAYGLSHSYQMSTATRQNKNTRGNNSWWNNALPNQDQQHQDPKRKMRKAHKAIQNWISTNKQCPYKEDYYDTHPHHLIVKAGSHQLDTDGKPTRRHPTLTPNKALAKNEWLGRQDHRSQPPANIQGSIL